MKSALLKHCDMVNRVLSVGGAIKNVGAEHKRRSVPHGPQKRFEALPGQNAIKYVSTLKQIENYI